MLDSNHLTRTFVLSFIVKCYFFVAIAVFTSCAQAISLNSSNLFELFLNPKNPWRHTHITSSFNTDFPFHRSELSFMEGIFSHRRQGIEEGALLWMNPKIAVTGLNDIRLSLGLGHRSRFIMSNKTVCYYLYYDINNTLATLTGKQPVDQYVTVGMQQDFSKISLAYTGSVNTKLLQRDWNMGDEMEKNTRHSRVLGGCEFTLATHRSSKYAFSGSLGVYSVLHRALSVGPILQNASNNTNQNKTYPVRGLAQNALCYFDTKYVLQPSFRVVTSCDLEYSYNKRTKVVLRISSKVNNSIVAPERSNSSTAFGVSVQWNSAGHVFGGSSKSALLKPVTHRMFSRSLFEHNDLVRDKTEHFVKTGYTLQEEKLADEFAKYTLSRELQLETAQLWLLMSQKQRLQLLLSNSQTGVKRLDTLPPEIRLHISQSVIEDVILRNYHINSVFFHNRVCLTTPFGDLFGTGFTPKRAVRTRHTHLLLKYFENLKQNTQQARRFVYLARDDEFKEYDNALGQTLLWYAKKMY